MREKVTDFLSKLIKISGKILVALSWLSLCLTALSLLATIISGKHDWMSGLFLLILTLLFIYLPLRLIGKTLIRRHASLAEWSMKYSVIAYLEKREADPKRPFIQKIKSRNSDGGLKVVIHGGAGWDSLSGREMVLSLDYESLYLTDLNSLSEHKIPYVSIEDVNIGGPGTVTAGGGFSGGGFGIDGFLVGATAATLANLLTTNTTTRTFVRIDTDGAELFLLVSALDPQEMRRWLSQVYAAISKSKAPSDTEKGRASLIEEITKLGELHKAGTITDDEFSFLKSKLLSN